VRLPNGENAVADIEKLRGYCLSAAHPEGRHKARVVPGRFGDDGCRRRDVTVRRCLERLPTATPLRAKKTHMAGVM
jgi:hypothetical protein